jgi:nitric oxide dioxygenase
MTPQQIDIIRTTFGTVLLAKDDAARVFYDRLFAIAPDTRALFKGDMAAQRKKLMDTLSFLVAKLRDLQSYAGMLEGLAQRHVAYGATRAHYDSVGAALIFMLEQRLGPAFTPGVKVAWTALFGEVAAVMQRAAYADKPAA